MEHREAPAVFKYKSKYYLITSLCSGWDPNAAMYAVADSMMGKWKNRGNPCIGRDSGNTFHAQSTYVLPLKNKGKKFIFMADRWDKLDLEDSRYVWLPLKIINGKPRITWVK
jgi:hypothetical protein